MNRRQLILGSSKAAAGVALALTGTAAFAAEKPKAKKHGFVVVTRISATKTGRAIGETWLLDEARLNSEEGRRIIAMTKEPGFRVEIS